MPDDPAKAADRLHKNQVEFIKRDLDLALTFVRIALHANYPAKKTRNQEKARQAYDAIQHWAGRISLSAADAEEITPMLRRLESELRMLGEAV